MAKAGAAKTKKPVAAKKPVATKKPAAKPAEKYGTRADFGAPIAAFFAKQAPALRPVLDSLRALVEAAAPTASAAMKWGMPFFELDGEMVCAIGAHKTHAALILPGEPGTYPDPNGLLSGDGKTGRRLKVASLVELPRADVQRWLTIAVARTRA